MLPENSIKAQTSPLDQSCPLGDDLRRYWNKRHDLFSKWDEGILVDRQGLYSVKPEAIALAIAKTVPGTTIIDGLCGVGGIAIALARTKRSVIAVDHDKGRLAMAEHNAHIYGVGDLIQFVHADILKFLCEARADSVFFDPDWGGPTYCESSAIRLSDLHPDGHELITAGALAARTIIMCVPSNFTQAELHDLPCMRVSTSQSWTMWGRTICSTVMLEAGQQCK